MEANRFCGKYVRINLPLAGQPENQYSGCNHQHTQKQSSVRKCSAIRNQARGGRITIGLHCAYDQGYTDYLMRRRGVAGEDAGRCFKRLDERVAGVGSVAFLFDPGRASQTGTARGPLRRLCTGVALCDGGERGKIPRPSSSVTCPAESPSMLDSLRDGPDGSGVRSLDRDPHGVMVFTPVDGGGVAVGVIGPPIPPKNISGSGLPWPGSGPSFLSTRSGT